MDKVPNALKAPDIAETIAIFISYASTAQDEQLFKELETRLKPLLRTKSITTWHQGKLSPGDERQRMTEQLARAAIILLLISPDYAASEDCMLEMERALALSAIGKAKVIPIHLRPAFIPDDPLHELQSLPRDGQPLTKHADQDDAFKDIVQEIHAAIKDRSEKLRPSQRERDLKALLADHSGFLQDRLKSFVGRVDELTRLRELIQERQQTGGYITITGQAGQGKSSIIARLVEEYGIEQVASHFIPLSPGPDHQVGLLRNLMARLILKYNLTELYVASDNRAALRDYFPKVLHELVEKGGREIIFIDGLDQLEEDHNGVRDLSFLPTNPPPGVVFVLGTRPNDTMKPLELLKPHNEYCLPNLSRSDFDLILEHRKVALEKNQADQFYAKMAGNALYLDLVARELLAAENVDIETLIARLTDNPDYIFSLSMQRLQRHTILWEKVIYPTFGLLLAAQEPLAFTHLKMLLGVPDYQVRDGLVRMGGLITEDQQRRHNLFHLKLRDYLSEDKEHPDKEYLFSVEEVQHWHEVFADWCEQGSLQNIWQDTSNAVELGRRMYSRHHYIAHLYHAHQRERLFAVLDEGSYGKEKMRFDLSTHEYAQDLNYGRQAAAWNEGNVEENIAILPHLWRYTLFQCSLRSQADNYPVEAFRTLLVLGREKEAIGLAELLTDSLDKVKVLLEIADYFSSLSARKPESAQLFLRVYELVHSMENDYSKAEGLKEVVSSLARAQQWKQAETIALSIKHVAFEAEALSSIASSLAHAQQWKQAETIALSIKYDDFKDEALSSIASSLAHAQQWKQAETIARSIKHVAFEAQALGSLASSLAHAQQWKQAETIALSIKYNPHKVQALSSIASSLAHAQHLEQAQALWLQAETIALSIKYSFHKDQALSSLASSLAHAQQWKQAETITFSIERKHDKAQALISLASSLAHAHHLEQAQALWLQAETIARSIDHITDEAQALSSLVSSLAHAQQWKQAETIALSLKRDRFKVQALSSLASSLAHVHHLEQAQALWLQAETIARSTEENLFKVQALISLASSLAHAHHLEQAQALWLQAETIARSLNFDLDKDEALVCLASSLARTQRWKQAETIALSLKHTSKDEALACLASSLAHAQRWKQAETIARSINDITDEAQALSSLVSSLAHAQQWKQAETIILSLNDRFKVQALISLASSLAHAHHLEQAQALWLQAETITLSLKRDRFKVQALISLASSLAHAHHLEQAQALWLQAETITRSSSSLSSRLDKVQALISLASSLAHAQRLEQAQALWLQAETITFSIERKHDKVQALISLASSLTHAQRLEQAQALWLQAETITLSFDENSLKEANDYEEEQSHNDKNQALSSLASSLVHAQRLEQGEIIALSLDKNFDKAPILKDLVSSFLEQNKYERALNIIQNLWLQTETRDDALLFFPVTDSLITVRPELSSGFYESFQWVDAALQ